MNYYFDMGWVKLFYRYGVVPGSLYIAACLALMRQMYKRRDVCALLLFAAFAVYTVTLACVDVDRKGVVIDGIKVNADGKDVLDLARQMPLNEVFINLPEEDKGYENNSYSFSTSSFSLDRFPINNFIYFLFLFPMQKSLQNLFDA